jgi:hypothetical protein
MGNANLPLVVNPFESTWWIDTPEDLDIILEGFDR